MKTRFYIWLSLKTSQGFETYGQYYFGEDQQVADNLFEKLKGSRVLQSNHPLHIDFVETVGDLPNTIKTITCTLDELAENSKLIAREIFKIKNLEAYEE